MCEKIQEQNNGILDDEKFDDYYGGPRKALRHIISGKTDRGCIQPEIMEFYDSEEDLGKRVEFLKGIYGLWSDFIEAGFLILEVQTSNRGMRIKEYSLIDLGLIFDLTVSWEKIAVCIQEAISYSDYYRPNV